MIQDLELHRAARRSLLSIGVTAALITINHLYALGPKAFGLGVVLIVAPTLLLWWFKRTRSNVAFGGYLLMNLWVVIGFGLLKGLWKSALPVFAGAPHAHPSSPRRPASSPSGSSSSPTWPRIGIAGSRRPTASSRSA